VQHAPQPEEGSHAAQPAALAVARGGRPEKSLAVCPSIKRAARKSATLIAPAVKFASLTNGRKPRGASRVHLGQRIRPGRQRCGQAGACDNDSGEKNPTIHHTNSVKMRPVALETF